MGIQVGPFSTYQPIRNHEHVSQYFYIYIYRHSTYSVRCPRSEYFPKGYQYPVSKSIRANWDFNQLFRWVQEYFSRQRYFFKLPLFLMLLISKLFHLCIFFSHWSQASLRILLCSVLQTAYKLKPILDIHHHWACFWPHLSLRDVLISSYSFSFLFLKRRKIIINYFSWW